MRINTTTARIPRFGSGVFMTKMPPTKPRSTLLENIYLNNSKYDSKLECAFAIQEYSINAFKFTDPMHPSRDLWKVHDHIDLTSCNFNVVIRN